MPRQPDKKRVRWCTISISSTADRHIQEPTLDDRRRQRGSVGTIEAEEGQRRVVKNNMPNPTRLRPNESVVQNINVNEQFELMLKNSYGVNASTGEAINPKTTKSSREDSAAHDLLAVSARLKDCSALI